MCVFEGVVTSAKTEPDQAITESLLRDNVYNENSESLFEIRIQPVLP